MRLLLPTTYPKPDHLSLILRTSTLSFFLGCCLVTLTACDSNLGVFSIAGNTLTVTRGTIATQAAKLDPSQLRVQITAGSISNGEVELRSVVLVYQPSEADRSTQNVNFCPSLITDGSNPIQSSERCLIIPSLRFSKAFEQCTADSNNNPLCFFQSGQTRTLEVEVADPGDGLRTPTNQAWEIPCKVASTAQILFFVGFREEPDISFALRSRSADNPSTDPNLGNFQLTCR